MGYVGCDALMNYESEARSGRPDALYSLGLAYSTGQGVGVDYVAAHKWFNLAAMNGVDEARAWRAPPFPGNRARPIFETPPQTRQWRRKHRLRTKILFAPSAPPPPSLHLPPFI